MKTFSGELGKKRKAEDLSLRQVEKAIGVSHSALNRYERGRGLMEMRLKHALPISKFFRWDLTEMARLIAREVGARQKAIEEAKRAQA